MKIGITFNLRQEVPAEKGPIDLFEEFDCKETIQAIAQILSEMGHEVKELGWGKEFLQNILSEKIDLVFNIAEGMGKRSREAQVPAVLEMLDIPYTFSDTQTLTICMDKALTKKIVSTIGVKTPKYFVTTTAGGVRKHRLRFPLFVKPALEGSSKGIRLHSIVKDQAELEQQVTWVLKEYGPLPVLVEEFIRGREVTVGVLGNDKPHILGIMEIRGKNAGDEFVYSLEVKRNWQEEVEYCCPSELDHLTAKRIARDALKAYTLLGCRDAARFDFRVDCLGQPYFLEVNPLAGLSPEYSDLTIMAKKSGYDYPWLIRTIVNLAIERNGIETEPVNTTKLHGCVEKPL
ncbi:MAG: ATP-grasp domain-containing protein [Syntrophomonadaceae bacterium]|nr:ATP-grasp domain-containing protein [Syntrophomonadaceae bacterium]